MAIRRPYIPLEERIRNHSESSLADRIVESIQHLRSEEPGAGTTTVNVTPRLVSEEEVAQSRISLTGPNFMTRPSVSLREMRALMDSEVYRAPREGTSPPPLVRVGPTPEGPDVERHRMLMNDYLNRTRPSLTPAPQPDFDGDTTELGQWSFDGGNAFFRPSTGTVRAVRPDGSVGLERSIPEGYIPLRPDGIVWPTDRPRLDAIWDTTATHNGNIGVSGGGRTIVSGGGGGRISNAVADGVTLHEALQSGLNGPFWKADEITKASTTVSHNPPPIDLTPETKAQILAFLKEVLDIQISCTKSDDELEISVSVIDSSTQTEICSDSETIKI